MAKECKITYQFVILLVNCCYEIHSQHSEKFASHNKYQVFIEKDTGNINYITHFSNKL